MGWFDNANEAEKRRQAEQKRDEENRRRKEAERNRRVQQERAQEKKKQALERKTRDEANRAEDEKAIAQMMEQMGVKPLEEVQPETKEYRLNRGSGFSSFNFKNQSGGQPPAEFKIPGPVGFDRNAPREGRESEGGDSGAKSNKPGGGLPPLRRP